MDNDGDRTTNDASEEAEALVVNSEKALIFCSDAVQF